MEIARFVGEICNENSVSVLFFIPILCFAYVASAHEARLAQNAVSAKDKGWARITKVLNGNLVGVTIGDPRSYVRGLNENRSTRSAYRPNPRHAIVVR
jgi:hypothetical protein